MIEAVISLVATTTLLLGSPGPAPLALAATGATHGIKNGVPFLIGILVGLSFAIIGATAGLAVLFSNWPSLRHAVQFLGALYIVYVAFKIATAPVAGTGNYSLVLAPSFRDGFILNLLNPKAYAAFLAIFSQFLLPLADTIWGYILTGIVCLIVAAIVDAIWLCFGGILRPIFNNPLQARVLRVLFAVLMVAAVVWVLI